MIQTLTLCKNSKVFAQKTQKSRLLKMPGCLELSITTITGRCRIPGGMLYYYLVGI